MRERGDGTEECVGRELWMSGREMVRAVMLLLQDKSLVVVVLVVVVCVHGGRVISERAG